MKKQRGITLVALVITIIILLILAGISIQALTNQGIFAQAEEAKKRTENAQKEEEEILTNYLEQMNAITGGQVTESVLDGAVVTPINDITTWLKTGGISKQYSYTTIEQVIADSACTESLMNNENAMKYLARSTEFADVICASETAMTYLGQSAYVDDTVLNSDSWKQSIKASQYWTLVYTSKNVTVYGGAYETITIEGYSGSFTTNSDGSVSHVVPIDTITLTGSVSGQSFTKTITNDTTEVKVMPEGAVYWYGNNCTDVTGGLCEYYNVSKSENSITFNPDHIEVKNYPTSYTSWAEYGVGTQRQVDMTNYSTIKAIVDDLRSVNSYTAKIGLLSTKQYFGGTYTPNVVCAGASIGSIGNDHEIVLDVSSMSGSYYLCVYSATSVHFRLKQLLLEK